MPSHLLAAKKRGPFPQVERLEQTRPRRISQTPALRTAGGCGLATSPWMQNLVPAPGKAGAPPRLLRHCRNIFCFDKGFRFQGRQLLGSSTSFTRCGARE